MTIRKKGSRTVGSARTQLREKIAKGYKKGKSIRVLAIEHAVSIGLARNLLVEANVTFRKRGGALAKKAPAKKAPAKKAPAKKAPAKKAPAKKA